MAHRPTAQHDTERTERDTDPVAALPKKGEYYRCQQCGMELEITSDCNCQDADMVRLECCGQELARV
jgi:hypothetical protein